MKNFLRKSWLIFAILIILAALFISLARAFTPWMAQYKSSLEKYLSSLLKEPVKIEKMETGWYWFEPVLKLKEVSIFDSQKHVIELRRFLVGIDPLRSLLNWRIEPGVLYIDKIQLNLVQADNQWQLQGVPLQWDQSDHSILDNKLLLNWLRSQPKIILRNLTVNVHFQDGRVLAIKNLNFSAVKRFGQYRLKGNALIQGPKSNAQAVKINLLSRLQLGEKNFRDLEGELYLGLNSLKLHDWKSFFSNEPYRLLEGQANGEFWFNIHKGQIKNVQSKLEAGNVIFQDVQNKRQILINQLQGNIALEMKAHQWILKGNDVALTIDHQSWPRNQFQIEYEAATKQHKVYIQYLWLDSLFTLPIPWPKELQLLVQRQLHGLLEETQLHFKNHTLDMILSRFKNLAWCTKGPYPGAEQVSGAIYWQPNQGRLELDSLNTELLSYQRKPPVTFKEINGALHWETINQQVHYKLDRLLLRHPDLLLNAQGDWDYDLAAAKLGQINIAMQLSAHHAQLWLDYLPRNKLKKKLENWVLNDIKRIDKLSANLQIQGEARNFPFEQTPGVFNIDADMSGVDLYFAPRWPLARNISGHINVKKRILNADVVSADLQNIPVKHIALKVENLGSEQDTMFVQGRVGADFTKVKSYLLASPLNKKLAFLNNMDGQGNIGLDLKLEIPLYPAKDEVLALGNITFQDNTLNIHRGATHIPLEHFNGDIQFDHKGVIGNNLSAHLLHYPIEITIRSEEKPKPVSIIRIYGQASLDQLRQTYPMPLMKFLSGQVAWIGTLRMEDNKEPEHLEIQSNLQNVAIDLPEPFGKKSQEVLPFKADIDFHSDTKLGLAVDYGHRLNSYIWFHPSPQGLKFQSGSIQINQPTLKAALAYEIQTNELTGMIHRLYMPAQKNKKNISENSWTQFKPKDLPNMNLKILDYHYGAMKLGEITLKGRYQEPAWVIDVLKINGDAYQLDAKGQWIKTHKKNVTELSGKLVIERLAKLLELWGITPAVDAKSGQIDFNLNWPGGLQDFSLKHVAGEASVHFKNGLITHLSQETEEKLGLGKLLSILSLQTIPRRLTLDFSDLSNKGYTFDKFEGHFHIARGLLTTKDSYIDGPVAYAGMQGDIDVVRRLYNVDLKIVPHITASLPVVATIAGGPVIGVAAWVASKIINHMQRISAYTYKISGPWNAPIVEQEHLYKAER